MPTHSDSKGVKLPKFAVPVFNGNIFNLTSFWEQFCISVHDRSSLYDAEKFIFLQQALTGGTAQTLIDGLTQSGEYYNEAVKCLKLRYNRPKLIHKAHVKLILEVTPLKDGNGKELGTLWGIHYLSSNLMSQPCLSGNLIVRSVLASLIIKTYDFFNLRAQATELHVSDRVPKKLNKPETHSSKKMSGYINSLLVV